MDSIKCEPLLCKWFKIKWSKLFDKTPMDFVALACSGRQKATCINKSRKEGVKR